MNDVRDICDRMLAAAPPLRDSTEILATARRSARQRRRAGLASAGLLAVTALAATAALAAPGTPGNAPATRAAPVGAAPAATAPDPVPRGLPPARAAAVHAATMRALLLAAVPAGYPTSDFPVSYDEGFDPTAVLPNERYPAPDNGMMDVAFAGLLLTAGEGQGLLSASIWASARPWSGAPCAASGEPAGRSCEQVVIDGVAVEVVRWRDEAGEHISATRRLHGGALMVIASQGLRSRDPGSPPDGTADPGSRIRPPLPTLPFTSRQIATLAADPAMLQFR